jgi:hypothetical protein
MHIQFKWSMKNYANKLFDLRFPIPLHNFCEVKVIVFSS